LARLGQVPKQNAAGQLPDFVFYTGCNVLKTPHIALLALDVMDALGISYEVMGGTTNCCGVQQLRAGDLTTFGRVAENTLDKLARSKTGEVLSWCPSCQVQFTEMTLPTVEKTRGAKSFDMTPFTLFQRRHLDRMRPLLRERVPMRIALHRHPRVHGVVEAAEEISVRGARHRSRRPAAARGRAAGQQFARPASVPPDAATCIQTAPKSRSSNVARR
jgi:hypothetical protein